MQIASVPVVKTQSEVLPQNKFVLSQSIIRQDALAIKTKMVVTEAVCVSSVKILSENAKC